MNLTNQVMHLKNPSQYKGQGCKCKGPKVGHVVNVGTAVAHKLGHLAKVRIRAARQKLKDGCVGAFELQGRLGQVLCSMRVATGQMYGVAKYL